MKKKRKTREQKIKSSQRVDKESTKKTTQPIKAVEKSESKVTKVKKEVKASEKITFTKNKDIKRSLAASSIILTLNIILFILLSSNTINLGFLGY